MAGNYPSNPPLTTTETLQRNLEDHTIIHMPIYSHPSKNNHNHKRSSKCFVHLLTFLFFLCLTLFVFSIVVLKIKPPTLKIDSISIKSLNYDYSPSFNLTLLMRISIENRNFGHFELKHHHHNNNNNTNLMTMIYGNMSVVGESKLRFKSHRVVARGKEEVGVEMKVSSLNNLLKLDDRKKLYKDLNSGVLELKSYGRLKGKVHLLKKIKRPTVAVMNCAFALDLRRKLVQALKC